MIGAYVGGQGVGSPAVTLSWSYSNAGGADRSFVDVVYRRDDGDHVVEKKYKFYFTTLGILKLEAYHMIVFDVLCLRGWYIYI